VGKGAKRRAHHLSSGAVQMVGTLRFAHPTLLRTVYNGKLSCFFAGISTFLSFSIASARAIRRRVECGMMTSSR
jgi:hypothetical protein